MNIVNVGYDSTNYWMIGGPGPRLLVDVGWPGTLSKLMANLTRKDIKLSDVGHLLVTHYHPDHASIAQELKNKGVRLIVLEQQVAAIPVLRTHIKETFPYVEISLAGNTLTTCDESRAFLRMIGFDGEIVATPGHSDDSVSLLLDDGSAFTGDLTSPRLSEPDSVAMQSWRLLRNKGAKTVYPGHGPVGRMPEV